MKALAISKPIGGFFELETPRGASYYHSDALALSNGRACLNVILKTLKPSHIYVPFYSCDTLIAPAIANGIKYTFYPISQDFEPINLPDLGADELFVYINYFGLKGKYARQLGEYYRDRVVIDNTQAYFEKGYAFSWSFNSCRKFFGVPDGAFLYPAREIDAEYSRNRNFIIDHLFLRLDGRQKEAFAAYQQNEMLQDCVPYRISMFSEKILKGADHGFAASRRRANFQVYHFELSGLNQLGALALPDEATPFCYPLLLNKKITPSYFHEKSIFIPMLWKEVAERRQDGFHLEKGISENMLALPLDQRYSEEDLHFVINAIKELQ